MYSTIPQKNRVGAESVQIITDPDPGTLFELISYVSGRRAKKKSSESKMLFNSGPPPHREKPEAILETDSVICSLQGSG